MKFLDNIPLTTILVIAVFMALAPIYPQPHLVQKIDMLVSGQLTKPLDIFDLFLHSSGLILAALKGVRMLHLLKSR
jgi:hypothetical protein